MKLDNHTRHPHGVAVLTDHHGRDQLVVVVKPSFRLSLGIADPDLSPAELWQVDVLDSTGALRCPADFAPHRPSTSVICLATARAPQGKPIGRLAARIRVGPVDQRFTVTGKRVWQRAGTSWQPSEPEPFVTMPLDFEHAYGGRDGERCEARNPVGQGYWDRERRSDPDGVVLPSVEAAGQEITSPEDHPEPAAGGAIAGHWQPRLGFAGTYDEAWQKSRAPLLPVDFDERFFQISSHGLQPAEHLRGGEPIELEGLTSNGLLCSAVPRPLVRVRIDRTWARPELDIVTLEPDWDRISLTLRVSVDVTGRLDALPKIAIVERQLVQLGAA